MDESDTSPIDLSEIIRTLCDQLDVSFNDAFSIQLTPSKATIQLYLRNEEGRKYIVAETGDPASITVERHITT